MIINFFLIEKTDGLSEALRVKKVKDENIYEFPSFLQIGFDLKLALNRPKFAPPLRIRS